MVAVPIKPAIPVFQRQHPLALGMTNAYIMSGQAGGSGSVIVDPISLATTQITGTGVTRAANGVHFAGNQGIELSKIPNVIIDGTKKVTIAAGWINDDITFFDGTFDPRIFAMQDAGTSSSVVLVSGDVGGPSGKVSVYNRAINGVDTSATTLSAVQSNGVFINVAVPLIGGSGVPIYINGVAQSTDNGSNFSGPSSNNDAWIGARNGGIGMFQGEVDYVYFWNRLLTPAEIALLNLDPYAMFRPAFWPGIDALGWIKIPAASTSGGVIFRPRTRQSRFEYEPANLKNGLTGWWPLNGSLEDIYGTNQGKLVGISAPTLPVPAGGVTPSVSSYLSSSVNGTNNWGIYVGNGATLANAAACSIACWVRIDSVDPSVEQFIAVETTGSPNTTRFGLVFATSGGGTGNNVFYARVRDSAQDPTGSGSNVVGVTQATFGSWYHLAGVYDSIANIFAIYVNGIVDNSTTTPAQLPLGGTTTAGITLGGITAPNPSDGISSNVNGRFGDVRFYKRRLLPAEILALARQPFIPNNLSIANLPQFQIGASTPAGTGGLGALLSSYRSRLIRAGLTIS